MGRDTGESPARRSGSTSAAPVSNRSFPLTASREHLNGVYDRYNRREYVPPDPLMFLYGYSDPRDREIVGLIASSLAYGRVEQIARSVSRVLERMGPSPYRFLAETSERSLQQIFAAFRHRFTTGQEMADLLAGARRVIGRFGTLCACFHTGFRDDDETVLPALTSFVSALRAAGNGRRNGLLPSPSDGSACKRWQLFLRWMVRRDAVDPGGWSGIPPCKLIVPLDTHMQRICLSLGLTRRKQANLRAALEVTAAFRAFHPCDPVRYDFALTRLGMREGSGRLRQPVPFRAHAPGGKGKERGG